MKGEGIAETVGRAILDAVAQPHRVLDVGRAAVLATLDAIREPSAAARGALAPVVTNANGVVSYKLPLEQWQDAIDALMREVEG